MRPLALLLLFCSLMASCKKEERKETPQPEPVIRQRVFNPIITLTTDTILTLDLDSDGVDDMQVSVGDNSIWFYVDRFPESYYLANVPLVGGQSPGFIDPGDSIGTFSKAYGKGDWWRWATYHEIPWNGYVFVSYLPMRLDKFRKPHYGYLELRYSAEPMKHAKVEIISCAFHTRPGETVVIR